jgi:anti-anti-sigma factor
MARRPAVGFTMRVRPSPESVLLSLSGDLDLVTAPELWDTLDELMTAGYRQVVLDLSQLHFLDARGLRVIARAASEIDGLGGRLTIRAPGRMAARLLRLTGLDRMVDVQEANDLSTLRRLTGGVPDPGGRPPDPDRGANSGGDAPGFGLAREFASVARSLVAQDDLASTLNRICAVAVERIPRCDHASVTLLEGRQRMYTRAATGPIPEQIDQWQYEALQGPCLEATAGEEVVSVADVHTDGRWPEFSRLTRSQADVRSVMSFRLFNEAGALGSLNLYSGSTGAFAGRCRASEWGRVFAAHASVALAGAKVQGNLLAALETRETISVAIGILMGRQDVSRQQAFDILRRASQRMNVKLRDVAARIAGGGGRAQRLGRSRAAGLRRSASSPAVDVSGGHCLEVIAGQDAFHPTCSCGWHGPSACSASLAARDWRFHMATVGQADRIDRVATTQMEAAGRSQAMLEVWARARVRRDQLRAQRAALRRRLEASRTALQSSRSRAAAERLERARLLAGLSIPELWVDYYALGGANTVAQLTAILRGDRPLTREDHDRLALALNDRFREEGFGEPLSYWGHPADL